MYSKCLVDKSSDLLCSQKIPVNLFRKHRGVKMAGTTLEAIILGDLPNEKCWRVWAKKINGEWSPESPAVLAPFSPREDGFHMVGECWFGIDG